MKLFAEVMFYLFRGLIGLLIVMLWINDVYILSFSIMSLSQ